jgi:hypothetical protein
MDVVGAALGIAWIVVVSGAIAWVGLRLRRRSIERGNYPFRNLPWYLGGTPEMPLRPPDERESRKR